MKAVFDTCAPRPEVLEGDLREEIFAARLKDVIEGTADRVYQDPIVFFDNTYPTEGLRLLLEEALMRLAGAKPARNAVIRLETAFGGGKTHSLIALYHVARGFDPGPRFVAANLTPRPGSVRVVGIVGWDLEPRDGLSHGDVTTYTLWGELAYQLGGPQGYALVAGSDRDRAAPGPAVLEKLIGGGPALIMLDEVARHLRAAKAVRTASGKSDLAEQTVAFLMSLFEYAASRERVAVVFTLADSADAFGKETEELRQAIDEARRLSARQERVITPTGETEIAAIVTHRLFARIDPGAAKNTADSYAEYYRRLLDQSTGLPERAVRAEYAREMVECYPFHPELLTTLNRKTSTIPNFQKTRGALRLLGLAVRRLWATRPADAMLIHPFHLDLSDEGIAGDLTSRLDRPAFKQVIEADIVSPMLGSPAHAQAIDTPWLGAGKPPYARRVATTVFLHSLTQGVATGVDPADLYLASLAPGDDPLLLQKACERLVETGWFFDWDGHRYRFKTEPSLNKIINDEMAMVGQSKAKAELDQRIRQVWKAGYLKPQFFPSEPGDIDDDADKPKLAIMHYDAVTATAAEPPQLVRHLFDHAGSQEGYRIYKNNVVFLVADKEQVPNMVQVARRYLALGRIVGDATRLREFSEADRQRLKKLAEAAELEVRVAITKAYRYLYYPSADATQEHSKLACEVLPPQDQGEVQHDQTHVVVRALKALQKVLTADDSPLSAAFVHAKAWDAGQAVMSADDLQRAFARRMALPILLDVNQLKKIIRNGISQGVWVYYDSATQIGYGKNSPVPAVQISDEALLYTPEEARRLGLRIKGETDVVLPPGGTCPVCGKPVAECICGTTPPCPVCGKSPCICGQEVRLHADGAPAQAFQALADQCADHRIGSIARLVVTIEGSGRDGAREARAIGLAIPQLGKGEFSLEQSFNAEFGAGQSLSVSFRGDWEHYKRLKAATDAFGQEASKLAVRTVLAIGFPEGLAIPSDQWQAIYDVFNTLGFGAIVVDAWPLARS